MSERPTVRTHLARAGDGAIWFRGLELTRDLIAEDFWSLVSLSIGHDRLTAKESAVVNACVNLCGVGDPRIWPLKVARLVGSYGHTFAAIAAANTMLDWVPIGAWGTRMAAELLEDVVSRSGSPAADREVAIEAVDERVARRDFIPGFGVAGRESDERYDQFEPWYDDLVEEKGRHWIAFQAMVERLETSRGLKPNIGGGFAASCLDIGFDAGQVGMLAGYAANWAIFANAWEAPRESPEILRRLPDDCAEYVGPPARLSPRAKAGRSEEE